MRLSGIFKDVVTKTVWSKLQRTIEKWNKILSSEIGPNIYGDLACDKVTKKIDCL